jgi:hypothetical protein
MGALKSVEGGRVAVDQAAKATILKELRQGRSIGDAMAAAGRTSGTGGGFAIRAQDVVRDASRYGFLQGGVGKLGEGNRFVRGSGNFNFNPFRSTATIAETATPGVFSLGRGVNFASNAGLAQGLGAVRGANSVANAGLYAQAAQRATGANNLMNGQNAQRMAGLTIADDVQRIETLRKTSEWAHKLGVTGNGPFRTLQQLGGSGRAVRNATGIVERGGNGGYAFARHAGVMGQRYASYAAVPLVGGAALGMTGRQVQPMWDYMKERDEIQAAESAQRELAEQEAVELERLYAEQQAAGAGGTQTGATAGAAVGASAPATAAVGAEQQVYVDPATGFYVDPQTGMMADPQTGQVYDQQGTLVGSVLDGAA